MLCMAGAKYPFVAGLQRGDRMTAAHEAGRLNGLNRLFAAIQHATDGGEVVPCLIRERSHLWLSEKPDEQQSAALGCLDCPALQACRSYVTEWPERSGVWGGRIGKREVPIS
jgi:hypothetical protein